MSGERSSKATSQNSWEADDDGGMVNPSGPQEPVIHREDEIEEQQDEEEEEEEDFEEEEDDEVSRTQSQPVGVEEVQVTSPDETRCLHCCHKVLRGIRALWATRETEDTKENRELHVKTTLRELCVFIVFLVVLCIVAFGMTTTMTYYYTSAVTELFINEPFAPSSTFADIGSAEDWYQYALGPLMKGLYKKMWPDQKNQTNGIVLFDSMLLGVPRLRLIRVRNDSCEVHEDFRNLITTCYGVYSPENEDTRPFGPMNGTAWTYQTDTQLEGFKHWGEFGVYGGGGYVQDLDTEEATSRLWIKSLQDNGWLERGTRAVFIDFNLYNANINLFCVVRLLCEFPATGGVISSWTLRTVKLIRYVSTFDDVVMACECIFVLFIAYYIVEEALEIKRHRWSYFPSFWSILDLLIIAISICCISFNIFRTIMVNKNIESEVNKSMNKFVDLDEVSYWQLVFNYTLAITVFLAWVKLFKFISFNKTMTQLSMTLGACVKDLIGYSVMFFMVFLAFAQLGYLLFGSEVEDYAKFETCIFSQFRILLGDFNFDDLERANRILGPVYFVLFVFFMFFILMNMFLAIIIDTYSEVKAELSHRKNDFEMTDYFKRGYQKMLDKLNLRRKKAVTVQKSMSSNKRVDYHEWHKDLKRRGYAEAEIVAVCSKYDLDKGHVLTAAEVHKMQADLDRKKRTLYNNHDKDGLDSLDDSDEDTSSVKSSLRRMSGGGVSHEEFSVLQRRVDRMEHSIGSIVSKIDAVLVKLENMEMGRAKRREDLTRLLDSIAESEGITDESKQHYMERLVRDELERWDSESCISGFDPSPASSSSGRGSGRERRPTSNPPEYPPSNHS